MVAEVRSNCWSPSTIPPDVVVSIDLMTMGQLEGGSEHKQKGAVVSPPPSPTTTKVQVQVQPGRKKRAYRKRKPSTNTAKRQLPADFQPSSFSVICGRGKECFDSEGNKRFRQIINKYLDDYAAAPGKSEKSAIVSKAMNIIRKASPQGAFVKCENGIWFEVSSRYAREKVGAWFRDCLHSKYKSSSKAKHARKMAKRVSGFNALDEDEIMNFPLDVIEFDMPELDDKFYDDIDHRGDSIDGTESEGSSKQEESTQKTGGAQAESITDNSDDGNSISVSDPEASSSGSASSTTSSGTPAGDAKEAQARKDPPGDIADKLNESKGSFYDIDEISLTLIPFDADDDL